MYVVTGATGFLGRELLVRILKRGASVLVTTRQKPGENLDSARARVVDIVRRTDGSELDLEKLEVCFADVTVPGLALSDNARAWLDAVDSPITLVHGAAEVRFDLPWSEMSRQNIQGTENVLELAESLRAEGKLRRFDYVSTAYVAGDRTDVAKETELDVGQTPRNFYEKSKIEAEKRVAAHAEEGLPATVHRPSIIVGDSGTGRAASFKVLYWPLGVYARGRWRTVFGRPDCTVDVVPVDFVADAMLCLLESDEATGRTFHLAAGADGQATIQELAVLAERFFGQKPVRYLDPDFYDRYLRPVIRPILRLFRPDVVDRGAVYLPYLKSNPIFDLAEVEPLLRAANIRAPKVEDYFERIMQYARACEFGRKPAPAQLQSSGSK